MKTRRYGHNGQPRRVLLVAPKNPRNLWSLHGAAELFGAKALMPNAALATLMALTPDDVSLEYTLCDENVTDLDLRTPCDLVAVTGTAVTAARMLEICRGFRERGVPVALGGPYATLEEEACRGAADHHFSGEAERTWPRFLRQWLKDEAEPRYRESTFVDLHHSPPPDWSLIDASEYAQIGVQSSRGCPNRCEFCDVIPFVGNRQRFKSVEQVLDEVRRAQSIGARGVFLSDDNFAAHRGRTERLLTALSSWNRTQDFPLSFSTQATLSLADDRRLLRLMADAQFRVLFVGLETIREQGLREANKTVNLGRPPELRLADLARHGLVPMLGLIVGFDSDDEQTFDELADFIEASHSPLFGAGLLNAPPGTPLHERLSDDGRLDGPRFSGSDRMSTNVVSKNLNNDELLQLNLEMAARLYEPARFGARLMRWLDQVEYLGDGPPAGVQDVARYADYLGQIFAFAQRTMDSGAHKVLRQALKRGMRSDPRLTQTIVEIMALYWHFHSFANDALAARFTRRTRP